MRSRNWLRRAVEALEPRWLLTSGYLSLNLVSDQPATALVQDPNLVNPWGLALNSSGGDLWVADSGTNLASLYDGGVGGLTSQSSSPFALDSPVVSIPGGSPTGVAANGSTSFLVGAGGSFGPASFLFASLGGQISGYNRFVPAPAPSTQAEQVVTAGDAVYSGLAVANNAGQNFLYAADFGDNRIDVFDTNFHSITTLGGFADPSLPAGYAPYNIVNLNGQLYVAYAKQGAPGQGPVAGAGNGFVDVFNVNGVLQKELIVGQPVNGASALNAPWAIVQAPASSFGDFNGDLLVGNTGDGLIHAFNPQTGALIGTLALPSGQGLAISGLHGLAFGNSVSTGNGNVLFYSAGINDGADGLLGTIQTAQGVSLVAQGGVVAATANESFSGTLAVFDDSQNLPVGGFTAMINWGDGGSATPGNITALPGGQYAVSGTHLYTASGAKSITIQIQDSLRNQATASALAQVAMAGLAVSGLTFTPTEGIAFTRSVATFTDGDGNQSPAVYQAMIAWGDGVTTAGTVSFAAGKFTVVGTHTYAEEGTDTALITVNDLDGTSASAHSTAKVADAPLTGAGDNLAATLGVAFNGGVASFTDANPNATLADFAATIDWGDGITTAGVVTAGPGAVFDVAGSHTYAASGLEAVTVTINDEGGSQAIVHDDATVTDIDVLGATLMGIAPTEGTRFTNSLAAIVDSNLLTLAGALAATIDWGDGSTTSGTCTGVAGQFAVAGSHLYLDEGFYSLTIVVAHVGGTAVTTATGTITVADTGTLAVNGIAVTATEGAKFSGEVATASDTYAAPVAGFTATIDWGDGTVSVGTLAGPNGQFTISGNHVYKEAGTYSPVVTIADIAPGQLSATGTATAIVADAPLDAAGTIVKTTEGQTFAGMVASFDDANPFGVSGDFTATIDWGDGTVSAGTVSGSGGFQVSGTHVYAIGGTYSATVTIADKDGGTADATSQMLVADYPLLGAGVSIVGSEGQSFSGTVATFVDTNPNGGNLASYSATINWGDGTTTSGSISGSGSDYTVSGIHAFVDVSSAVVIVIDEVGGASVTVTDAASIADANTLTPTGATLSTTEGQTLRGVLATFADTYTGNPASDFSAMVDWGDGQTTSATVTGRAGQFTVSGSHVYAEAGSYTASVALSHNAPGTAAATAITDVHVADAPLTASGTRLSSVEGSIFNGNVASFTDANLFSVAADFAATIDWGDGTPETTGTVTLTAPGSFLVSGTHLYADEAQGLPVTVTINDVGGGRATAIGTANISDAPITAGAVQIRTTEGAAFGGEVATFVDGNLESVATDFTATIDWGDGTPATVGTVSDVVGGFVVTGVHTYAEEAASLAVKVIINDVGGSSATAPSTAVVADAPLTASKVTFTATDGIAFTGSVASFSDANSAALPSDFTATIDWGDGTSATAGTVIAAGGQFAVTGSHIYARPGSLQVTVTINDKGGSSAGVTGEADVLPAPLSPNPPLTLPAATQGVLFSGTLGSFTDSDPNAQKTDFTATIDWGDGTPTSAGAVLAAPNQFLISGSHIYANPAATYAITITVEAADGAQATVVASMRVASTHFTAGGATLAVIEGATFSGAVAVCNDVNPNAAEYGATIAWGDGTTTAGTVVAVANGFVVDGTHVFAHTGSQRMSVVVTNPSLDVLTVSSLANVSDAPLTAAAMPIAPTRGMVFSGAVATFTDADPGGVVTDYSAIINWGDGGTSSGTITTTGNGLFTVVGSHTYAEATRGLTATITINDVGGAKASATSTVNVAAAPLKIVPASVTLSAGGTTNDPLLATFTDLGGSEALADYTATINWGDGTSLASGTITSSSPGFAISGNHDYVLPGDYTVGVVVSAAGGSTATASVSVSVTPTANQLYTEAVYLDLLARGVDNGGLVYWSGQLDSGLSRSVMIAALDHSAEYFGNIIISPAYQQYLGRAPDASGLAYWIGQMQNDGLTDEQLEAGFIGSPEFYSRAGGNDKAWVDAMYEDLLGRDPDPAGESYWVDRLAAGMSRADVAYGFAAGQERESQLITADYMHYLDRAPDVQGLDYWLAQFAAGVTNEDVITGFVASDEYFDKHSS
ncbi:MAG TPA: TIGR03118 family protein [Pirellulales bacterium]|nr:TIGR03118 family protein [Pirellulales bacterium]